MSWSNVFGLFDYFKRSHPIQLFWFVVLMISLTAYCILSVVGTTDCGCGGSNVKYKNKVRNRRRAKGHNCKKCSTCRELSQTIGQKLASYKDQEISPV